MPPRQPPLLPPPPRQTETPLRQRAERDKDRRKAEVIAHIKQGEERRGRN